MKIRELLAESKTKKVEPSKPRNFVAKNAINTGAGVHKDKKKAMKQGDVKHKKKEFAEGNDIVPSQNPTDTIELDVPLLIRLLEFAREDASGDVDLHDVAEKLIALASQGRTLTMKDYAQVVPEKDESVNEKAVSTAQQKFMGMVHAAQKGEKPASKEIAKVAKGMSKKTATDYASTKHKGLPAHVKETATAGGTSAGNVSVGAVYSNKKGKSAKNKDGTVKNALDVKGQNLLTGGSIAKR